MATEQDIQELEAQAAADQSANSSPSPEDAAADEAAKEQMLASATNESASGDNKGEDSMSHESAADSSLPNESFPQDQQPDLSHMVASSDRDDTGDGEDDSSDQSTAPQAPGKQPAANPAVAQAIDNAIQNPQVQQYLKQKYGFGSELDDAALKAAQDKALKLSNQNQFGRAADMAGYGFAQLGAGADWNKIKDDTSLLDSQEKLNQKPVENLLARRKGMIENEQLSTDQAKNQSLQDTVKTQLALSDPNSPESKMAQKAYLPILQKAGLDTGMLQGASANVIKTVMQQPLEFVDKQKQQELIAQSNHDLKKIQLESVQAQREFNNQFKANAFNDNQLKSAQAALNKDPQLMAASKSNDSIGSSLDTLELAKTNPIAFKANSLDLAKSVLAGAGKLNQTEINQFAGGSAAFQDRLKQIYDQAASGTISPENYDYSKQLLQHLQAKNNQIIQQRQQAIAGQLTSRNNGNVNQNLNKITGQQAAQQGNAPAQQPVAAPAQSSPAAPASQPVQPNEEPRQTKDGRTAIFDKNTKQFIRYQ